MTCKITSFFAYKEINRLFFCFLFVFVRKINYLCRKLKI